MSSFQLLPFYSDCNTVVYLFLAISRHIHRPNAAVTKRVPCWSFERTSSTYAGTAYDMNYEIIETRLRILYCETPSWPNSWPNSEGKRKKSIVAPTGTRKAKVPSLRAGANTFDAKGWNSDCCKNLTNQISQTLKNAQ